ncbi:MAG TPA: glycosyltransferase [Pyrinomonadaceae bacterium]|nr:glycosyltransferase [Pyrinomonadaceae bacterium]
MPTRNRRRFVGQSIRYFLRQDYPHKELLVLDDGDDAVSDLIPADERVRYVRLDRRLQLGTKRNLGCRLSRGELIAHWDDDDWMAPHRLSAQVGELLRAGADICGARELLHYGLDAGEAWLYRYPSDGRPWLAGGTLLYRRSAWDAHPFPEINVGEDNSFVWRHPSERITALPDSSFYVALIHAGNTSAKRLTDARWQRRSLDDVSQLLAPDREFYVGLRHGRAPQPAGVSRGVDSVTVGAPFMVYDGYGSMAELLVLGMRRAGASVNVVPLNLDEEGLYEEFKRVLRRSRPDRAAPALYFCWPRPDLERFRQTPDLFAYTMWESSRLPSDWPARLNRMRAVFVPTRFCARVCRESGVNVPVEVVPLGVDPEVYGFRERPERQQLTTLVIGTLVGRKHVLEAAAAWKLAFAGDPDARLVIKSRFRHGSYTPDDPRVTFVDSNETTRGIAHWYEQADVLVAAGSEGFGLPMVEAMATGLPVVALNSEGQSDLCEDAGPEFLLPVPPERWEEAAEPPFGRCGVRGVPGVKEMAARLRWVAGHREEARAMGRAASEWVIKHRNVWAVGPAVLDSIERRLPAKRTLRRAYTLFVPSWETPCGIAEYAGHLGEAMAGVRVTGRAPELRGVRVLHVQHEYSLFDDASLAAHVREARRHRVPVVITEHTVGRESPAWERGADALVALTRGGARTLRGRWPGKRVECIPCGCPTWFPPRKKRRGRVVGAFGFLEQHKGFWRLLEVLRALPGTEMLLVSHAKNPANEARWSRDAAGLPVRHRKEFLPVADAARLLAAEADILVYWYDEIPFASASSAVRVGLATGVPVLASPTSWFEELAGVTFQPRDLVEGVARLLEDTSLRERLAAAARDYCHEQSWPRTAERHLALWQSLEADR